MNQTNAQLAKVAANGSQGTIIERLNTMPGMVWDVNETEGVIEFGDGSSLTRDSSDTWV